jgi:hypothetical protein
MSILSLAEIPKFKPRFLTGSRLTTLMHLIEILAAVH